MHSARPSSISALIEYTAHHTSHVSAASRTSPQHGAEEVTWVCERQGAERRAGLSVEHAHRAVVAGRHCETAVLGELCAPHLPPAPPESAPAPRIAQKMRGKPGGAVPRPRAPPHPHAEHQRL
eukprot:1379515-Rhodomonas_salina.3